MADQKQTVKFGDICREVKLSSKDPLAEGYDKYIGLEHLDSGSLKIKRWGSIAEDKPSFTRVFKKGHILFGKRRPYLKKAAIAEFDGICSGDIIVMEPIGDLMLPELLPFIVQSEKFWDWAVKTSSGSLSPRTKFESVCKFEIASKPKFEQEKAFNLAAKALEVEQNINESLKALIVFKSIFVNEFKSGGLSSEQRFYETKLGKLPISWKVNTLGELFNNKDNMRVPIKSSDRNKIAGNIPYYGASGVIDCVDRFLFDEELLLLSEDGANLVDRNTPIAFKVVGKSFVNNHAHVYQPNGKYEIEIAVEIIESMDMSAYLTGTAQPKPNEAPPQTNESWEALN